MTQLNVTLSQDLQTKLTYAQGGTFAYAVYFDANGNNPQWSTLVENGVVQTLIDPVTQAALPPGVASISLPYPMVGGKVYFIVQSTTPGQPMPLPNGAISTESDINSGNAQANDFRYDSFEVTLQGAVGDAGNLTSVNGFGFPMDLSITYANNSTKSLGYNISGSTMFQQIGNINSSDPASLVSPFTQGPLATVPLTPFSRMGLSPSTAVGEVPNNSPFQPSNWLPYINSLKSTVSDVVISGFYNGSPSVNVADPTGPKIWHNAGYFAYQLTNAPGGEAFFLEALPSSQIKGTIQITFDQLAKSIYSTLGEATIWDNVNPTPFEHMNTGANNQWGEVFTNFITGFTAGYYGAIGNPMNGPVSLNQVDLNQNINWDPTYAFGNYRASSSPSVYYDEYSKIFFYNSNSYGSGYSDNLMSRYSVGGPLISVYDTTLKTNVSEIDITIYSDFDTPAGYVYPVIYNALAPSAGGYQIPVFTGGTSNIVLSMFNQGMIVKDGSPVSVDIFNGLSETGVPLWLNAPLTGASLWNEWDFSFSDGTYSLTANVGNPQATGSILLDQIPVSQNGVTWYRIHVGEKTFNFYTTTQGGSFENPQYSGGVAAIDGLATVVGGLNPDGSAPPLVPTLTVNFFNSSSSSLDPSLLVQRTDSAYISSLTAPASPVAGILSGSNFTAMAGQTSAGQTTDTENIITITTTRHVGFAWTGENSNANTASWISGYTNKLGATNSALIFFNALDGGLDPGPLIAHADIDGKWQSVGSQVFTNGVQYAAYFVEYAASDTTFSTPIGAASVPVVFTISLARSPIGAATDSDTVTYASSSAPMIIDLQSQLTWDGTKNDVLSHISNAIGSTFNDKLYGDSGNNVLDGGAGGADQIHGGAGSDTVNYESSTSGVIIDLIAQITWDGTNNDTLSSIEHAVGSSFNDTIYGDGGNNFLNGGVGGADIIHGGSGSDTVSYLGSPAGVIIDLIAQMTWDGTNNDTLSSIENAIGSSFDDKIYGDSGGNVLDGGAGGADQIHGGTGSDTVSYSRSTSAVTVDLITQMTWDGTKNDVLSSIENVFGSSFDDKIYGDSGGNVLDGSGGADLLSGGGGSDIFVFEKGGANGDNILDFDGNGAGAGDQLRFVGYGAGATFSMVDGTHWQIATADGLVNEVITLANGAGVHSTDYLFV